MNNDAYRTKDMATEGDDPEVGKAEETRRIATLRRLLVSADFKFFLEQFVQPRHDEQLRILRTTGVLEEAFRAQGALGQTGYLLEQLPNDLEALKNTIEHGEKDTGESPAAAARTSPAAGTRRPANARRRKA